jgi:hypothetical protein
MWLNKKSGKNSSEFPVNGNDIGEFFGYRNEEEDMGDGAIKKRVRRIDVEDTDKWLEDWLCRGD